MPWPDPPRPGATGRIAPSPALQLSGQPKFGPAPAQPTGAERYVATVIARQVSGDRKAQPGACLAGIAFATEAV